MGVTRYVKATLQVFNPANVAALADRDGRFLIKLFIAAHIVGLVVGTIIYLPSLYSSVTAIGDEVSEASLTVSVESSLNDTVTLLQRPGILVDFSRNTTGDDWIVATNTSLHYKQYVYFGERTIPYRNVQSVSEEADTIAYFTALLAPALLFWLTALFLVKNFVLVTAVATVGWMAFLHPYRSLSFGRAWKAALVTSVPMAVADVALWSFTLSVYPSIAFVLYSIYGFWTASTQRE